MSAGFKSGVFAIQSGELDVEVSGIALSFDPVTVHVSVRQPDSDSDIISAYLVGSPSRDGFSVALSSPAPDDGYTLEWTAFSGEVQPSPIAGDTLQVDYAYLKKSVSRFLGYNPDSLTEAQADEIDSYIQSGVRNFYYPPAMQGVDANFEWSFLRQNGEVSLSPGITDYSLPNGFGRMAGQLVYGDREARECVPLIPYGDIKRMIDNCGNDTGRPRFASVMASNEIGSRGQKKRLYVFPAPDKSYTLHFVCDADNGKIDEVNRPYPLGGPMFSELVTESCLSAAEQKANDEIGIHTQNFNTLLVSMIQRDRKSGAQVLGKYGDPRHRRFW